MRRSSIFTLLLILIVSTMLGSMTLNAHAQTDSQPDIESESQTANQPRPVLLASTIATDGSRAWTVYRNSQGEHLLVLIAPREASDTLSIKAAPAGQVQAMRPLGRRFPQALAAVGDRAYIVFPAVYANDRRLMRIYSATAFPSPIGGLWVIDPPDRLRTEHPIETKGELLDLQSTRDTIWALLEEDDTPRLLRLDREAWTPVALPQDLSTKRLDLVAIGNSIVLVDRSGTRFKATRYDNDQQLWTPLPDQLPLGGHTQLLASARAIIAIDWDEQDLARMRTWSPAGLFTLASDLELPSTPRYSVLDSSNTLLGMYAYTEQGDTIEPTDSVEITEFSLLDNAITFQGAPVASSPVSADEFRFLITMMILVVLGVLVVVIFPDRTGSMLLPDDMVLADPGRRLIATMLDALLVASITARFFNVDTTEILTLSVIVRPDSTWIVIPATMIVGVAYATITEWRFSATPAKLLVGIRVVRAETGPRMRPKLWSALVRNFIKWILPPVAALALIDPESLHRGDRASRTLVVTPRQPDPIPRDEDQ